ncbi:MAG TPA: cryptochrome/photolyase family protein [Bacteroidia bacterium]|nr:cryptochrome/photolyase family protein [Bacteroidia bacterium]
MQHKNEGKKVLRLILGDQLNMSHSWFKTVDDNVVYVLMEVKSETNYTTHHIQKLFGFFAAMRAFEIQLRKLKHQVLYIKFNDKANLQSFDKNIATIIKENGFNHFEYQLPDEYRVDQHLKNFTSNLSITHQVYDTEHFFTSRNELALFFKGKKTFLMESFYRYMRVKHQILIVNGNQPLHGQWNFDKDNREKLPKNHITTQPLLFSNNLEDIAYDVQQSNIKTIGIVDFKNFIWPINREQSLVLLEHFLSHCLHLFGTFQDAMAPHEWSLYHSRLSFALNIKLISPKEVIDKAIATFEKEPDKIQYNQLEGFVRQIVGWREYMRGVYWAKMPEYAQLNYLQHEEKLPVWFWTGETKMNCLKYAIKQSLQYAYAHHIQRLMITGNFALLAGVHPNEVDAWYLGIYIDALEWVEITNTRGMSQFADGGIVGSKPYVSSASYINKMSSYCGTCHYQKSLKIGDNACPFNSLYWNFYDKHEKKLAHNARIGMMYKVWQRMNPSEKSEILLQASKNLNRINDL